MFTKRQIEDYFIAYSRAETRLGRNARLITNKELNVLTHLAQAAFLRGEGRQLFATSSAGSKHIQSTQPLPESTTPITDQQAEALADNFDLITKDTVVRRYLSAVWHSHGVNSTVS
ncbi:MAG: hypothetical protein ABF676_07955 [Schleiferilactobacillus harbinensis]|uniref:hypothetical protein n=1 Tax=Schleiferilactobacillus harbinensis TaxID=304207 RepID=UPI0039E94436